jgi:hypothetical protein
MAKGDYSRIDDTDKELKSKDGLFFFPESINGKTDHGLRKFLIFYFDNDDDYNLVLSKLARNNIHVKSHPDMNAVALAELVRKAGK